MILHLPSESLHRARQLASQIAVDVEARLLGQSTIGIERALARLFGLMGVTRDGQPFVNCFVNQVLESQTREDGSLRALARCAVGWGMNAQQAAERFVSEGVQPKGDRSAEDAWIIEHAARALDFIRTTRASRAEMLETLPAKSDPLLYVIVATGNIHADVEQAKAAAKQGADVIAVIRSTAQSLLDHVPEGLTTEGFGGTYATQANFRLMRQALDEASRELGRYVRLTNYASGLCMAEMAVLAASERLDMMLADCLYGILFRDINMRRTFLDQHFARMILGTAGITINTGEDNYLTTDDAFEAAHTVLASQFINEAFAHISGLPDDLIGLGHAFEMNPAIENGLLYQMADALLSRTCFPGSPLKYMPPTRHINGNIFKAHVMDALFNLTSVATGQAIHLVGIMTEAVQTPFMSDRFLALENVRYVQGSARAFGDEFTLKRGGIIEGRAIQTLNKALALLDEIAQRGLFVSLSQGVFANTHRQEDSGRGRSGVFSTSEEYSNPFFDLILHTKA